MDLISQSLAATILFIGDWTRTFWDNLVLLNFSWPQITLDILTVAVIFYFIFALIKGSRAVHVLIGLAIILALYFLSKALQLVALGWLLDKFMTIVLVAIPIIFQKELRMGLERLGHTKLFVSQKAREIDRMILHIVNAVDEMGKNKIGALIVVQKSVPLKEYIDTGVILNAKVSTELLLSIFQPKGALHDGAVIIANENICAASCILPHSFENKDSGMGTRHKAALGLSENTDAVVVAVSEEKGTVSFAQNGIMERSLTTAQLHQLLTRAMGIGTKKKIKPKK